MRDQPSHEETWILDLCFRDLWALFKAEKERSADGRHLAGVTPGGAVGPRKGPDLRTAFTCPRCWPHESSPELRGLMRRDTVGERQRLRWLLILRRTFLTADHGISPSAPVGYRLGKSIVFRVSPGYSSL
uniref:Uncharacterized protein n=1 Tax=Rangifer tarandus platyrhynchus TaxID=3082113 RepID=A0ACB0FDG1_RANTA|nr:unnamed protein product [Rangifer tarandus platyrhynchus]